MAGFVRDELTVDKKTIFSSLVSAAAAESTMATPLAPGADGVVAAPKFDVRVEVPDGALPNGTRLAISTLAPARVAHLHEAPTARGQFVFSPVVQVEALTPRQAELRAAAASSRSRVDAVARATADSTVAGSAAACSFSSPLTLVMPHVFCPAEGHESLVMLAAPSGDDKWHLLQTEVRADGLTHGGTWHSRLDLTQCRRHPPRDLNEICVPSAHGRGDGVHCVRLCDTGPR